MPRVIPPKSRGSTGGEAPDHEGSLPLRWAVILIGAVGCGLAVGSAAGVAAGVGAGVALAGFLHKVLPKR